MDRLKSIEGAITRRFQIHEKKIFEKAVKIFEKDFKKGNENLTFNELMEKYISDEQTEELEVSIKEQLKFYNGQIIYNDIIEPEIHHISNMRLQELIDKQYGNTFAWVNKISEIPVEKIFNKIKERY